SAFYKDLAEHAAWRRENGDPWTWWVYRVVNGVDDGDCIIRSGPVSWADMDAYGEFGLKGSDKFWETVGEHVEDSHSWIGRLDQSHARWMPDMSEISLVSIIHYHTKPGMKESFMQGVDAFHNAIVEHDYPIYYVFDMPINGQPSNIITLALLFKDFADMEPEEEPMPQFIQRALGDEAEATLKAFQSSFTSTDSMILRYLPELSILHEAE
ncbi:MAG: hypothetical protein AB3N33_12875, partial [Puniceicoccaceae bacterium]